jgi:AraC-like DNA-binding protein
MRQEFCDFEELAEEVTGWGFDWVQLDGGPLEAAIQQASTPTAQFARFRFSRKFHQRGTTPADVRTFGLVGELSPDIEWRGSIGTNAHLLAFPTDDLFEVVSQPGFHGGTVSVPEDRIRVFAECMGVPDPLGKIPKGLAFIEVGPRRQKALREATSRFHTVAAADGPVNPTVIRQLESEIMTALVAALQAGRPTGFSPPEPRLRARALQSALDYIEAHADEPPGIQEICRASGASWRTLDYAFRDRFDVTPKQYLHAFRLRQVRREIIDTGSSLPISEIAAHWGFWHMGQFAKDYRRQFGELPSETVRRMSSPRTQCETISP